MLIQPKIVGRYAPSPTGELHFGNLRTALLAWLHARLQDGEFVVRIEDLDQPRVVVGSADQILRDLEWFGLDWDGPIVYQSERNHLYQNAIDELESQELVYACFCSRKDIQLAASAPHGKAVVYPGTCRHLSKRYNEHEPSKSPAIRIQVADHMSHDVGDFVVKRADSLFAYQLAVAVDDLDQGITEVVRGEDLYESTVKQKYLSSKLGLFKRGDSEIEYFHAPLMVDDHGLRMSKRDGSVSASHWKQSGRSAEELLGYLSYTAGILDAKRAISSQELLGAARDVDTLRLKTLLY